MKKNVFIKGIIGVLIIMMIVPIFGLQTNALEGEDIAAAFESVLEEDKLRETVTVKITSKKGVEVKSITLPDGVVRQGDTATYTSNKNGEEEFIVTYTKEVEGESGEISEVEETKTFTFEFKKITNGSRAELTNQVTTRSSATVDTTITVMGGTNSLVWQNNMERTVQVRADFTGNTTDEKTLSITIPKGMRYTSVEVDTSYEAASGVDETILRYLLEDSIHNDSVISTTVPAEESRVYYPATFGEVKYEISPTTKFVVFEFTMMVDSTRYYAPHDILNAISVTATCDIEGGESISDTSSIDIRAEGEIVMAQGTYREDASQILRGIDYSSIFTTEVIATEGETIGIGGTRYYITTHGSSSTGVRNYIPESATYNIYYPEGTEFYEAVAGGTTITRADVDSGKTYSNFSIKYDDNESKATITVSNMSNYGVYVKYKVPEGTPAGQYQGKQPTTLDFTTYNGVKYTGIEARPYSSSDEIIPIDVVTVLDPEDITTRYTFTAHYTYVDKDAEYFYAGRIADANVSSLSSKPTTVEITIEDSFLAKVVRIPADATARVSNIVVTTSLGKTINVDPSLTTYYMNRRTIDGNTIGLEEDEYIASVKADVGEFRSNFLSSNNGGNTEYKLAYGKLAPGESTSSISIKAYNTGDPDGEVIEGTSNISATTAKTTTTDMKANFNIEGEEVTSTYAGGTLNLDIEDAGIFNYPYGTMLTIQNPHVYIRESEGYEFDHDSIVFTSHQTGEEIDAELYKKFTGTNSEGVNETIYVYQLNDFIIARDMNYPIEKSTFDMSAEIITDFALEEDVTYKVSDMIGIGQVNLTGASSGYSDYFYENGIDANESGYNESKIPSLWKSNNRQIVIKKNNTAVVDTFLTLEGDTSPVNPYDPSDVSTAVEFQPGVNANYTVKINNLSNFPADSFTIYMPIPKAGQNYGNNFQEDDFSWNMKLIGEITGLDSKYKISYTNKATAENYEDPSIYGDISEDLPASSVNMVCIQLNEASGGVLEPGEEVSINIPLNVDESSGSEESSERNETLNVFNPYYYIESDYASGSRKGSTVGAKLVIYEVSGLVFEDINKDGQYQPLIDSILPNTKVQLSKLNEDTNTYEIYPSEVGQEYITSDENGKYSFGDSWGLTNGIYAVTFDLNENHLFVPSNIGDDKSDSDVMISGVVESIDPLDASSRYIYAGSIAYEDDYLQTHLNILEMEEGTYKELTLHKDDIIDSDKNSITPSHFDFIKSKTNGYTWTIDEQTIARIESSSQEDGSVNTFALELEDVSAKVTTISLEIEDIYSSTSLDTAPLIVYDENAIYDRNDTHVVAAQDATISYNQAKNLTAEEAIEITKAVAYKLYPEIEVSQIVVAAEKLREINSVARTGDIMPLSFISNGACAEVNITILSDALPEFEGLTYLEVVEGRTANIKAGVSASDYEDEDITASVVFPNVDIKSLTAGDYTLEYKVTDSDNNTVIAERKLKVLENKAPTIVGLSNKSISIKDAIEYDFKGDILKVEDDYSLLTSNDVSVEGVIKTPSEVGQKEESEIIYTVADEEGNETVVKIIITVTNYEPEITGVGDLKVTQGTTADLKKGVVATDFEDKNITNLIVYPTIDTKDLGLGTHSVEYKVEDSDGNIVSVYRNIVVVEIETTTPDTEDDKEEDTNKPVIVLPTDKDDTTNKDDTPDKDPDDESNQGGGVIGSIDDGLDGWKSFYACNIGYMIMLYLIIPIYILFMIYLCLKKRYQGKTHIKTNIAVTTVLFILQGLITNICRPEYIFLVLAIFMLIIMIGNTVYIMIDHKDAQNSFDDTDNFSMGI